MSLAASLREALEAGHRRTPILIEGDVLDEETRAVGITPAAVLVPVVDRPEPTVILTLRPQTMRKHPGQVSFPGGRAEPGDASAEFTALREAQEEIGLAPERVEILGRLPEYHTRTGFRVTPVIGVIEPPLELALDPHEVESVFEVPLSFLLDPANRERRTREFQGTTTGFYVYEYEGHVIWGATAGMLVNLHKMLE